MMIIKSVKLENWAKSQKRVTIGRIRSRCDDACKEWCESEYKEQPIDWSKVPVDTPILVKNNHDDEWLHRHFAKFEDGVVYSWRAGRTSWSKLCGDEDYSPWKYAKLVEGGE